LGIEKWESGRVEEWESGGMEKGRRGEEIGEKR
jgi:hypothetical protein